MDEYPRCPKACRYCEVFTSTDKDVLEMIEQSDQWELLDTIEKDNTLFYVVRSCDCCCVPCSTGSCADCQIPHKWVECSLYFTESKKKGIEEQPFGLHRTDKDDWDLRHI